MVTMFNVTILLYNEREGGPGAVKLQKQKSTIKHHKNSPYDLSTTYSTVWGQQDFLI